MRPSILLGKLKNSYLFQWRVPSMSSFVLSFNYCYFFFFGVGGGGRKWNSAKFSECWKIHCSFLCSKCIFTEVNIHVSMGVFPCKQELNVAERFLCLLTMHGSRRHERII